MRNLGRVVVGVCGVGLCVVGFSAGSKLFRETLDSPRWVIGGLALVALVVGVGALVAVVVDYRQG